MLITLLLGSGLFVNAKTTKSSLNSLTESLEQLVVIKKSDQLSSNEKDAIEITARQATFNRVLDLIVEELENLKKRLGKINHPNKTAHVNSINEYLTYHEIIRGQINKDMSADEIIDIASKFKKWRETNYLKEISKILDFVAVFQNQEAIKTTENRLERIVRDFKTIKTYLLPAEWKLAEKLLSDARKLIEEAKAINRTALESFDNALIQQANQNLTSAYKNFIALSEMVQ